jgi:hypothetical protein
VALVVDSGEGQNPTVVAFVESHFSQRTREMGHPAFLNPTSRKEREKWGTPFLWLCRLQRVSRVRRCSLLLRVDAALKRCSTQMQS